MCGTRVIIPSVYRKSLLEELHSSHSGIVRMKVVSRSLMLWPDTDQDIDQTCDICICRRPAVVGSNEVHLLRYIT